MGCSNLLTISKNNRGFTLVETLVAFGLVAILGFIVAQLIIQQSNNSHKVTDYFEVNELVIRIGESIRSKVACEYTFNGITMPSAASPMVPITQIMNADTSGGIRHVIFDMATKDVELSPRLKVTALELVPYDDNNPATNDIALAPFTSDTTLMRLQLNIRFEKSGAQELKFFRSIPLIVKRDSPPNSNKIFTCYTDQNAWTQELCNGLLSGKYTEADGVNPRMCSDLNVKNSISTDGHFCFNQLNGSTTTAGDIHQKDCINSWYAGWAQNYDGPLKNCYNSNGICQSDDVIAGVAVVSCGKNCVKSKNLCCPIRLRR